MLLQTIQNSTRDNERRLISGKRSSRRYVGESRLMGNAEADVISFSAVQYRGQGSAMRLMNIGI